MNIELLLNFATLNGEAVSKWERAGRGRVRIRSANHTAVFTLGQVRDHIRMRRLRFTTRDWNGIVTPQVNLNAGIAGSINR